MTDDQGPTEAPRSGPGENRRTLDDIAPRAWEHPADRAALQALRRIPVFDEVLKRVFGFFGEKPIRLAFQANAIRVSPTQFGHVHGLYRESLRTLDAPREYPLFISQTPLVNAGAYGMEEPFILLNSGTVRLLDDEELSYVLGHEVGHILSDHVLYRTMTVLLINLAKMGFPIVGLAARTVLIGLLEWSRKAELSADRAGLLAVQDPEVVMRSMLTMTGGGKRDETNLEDFIAQAEEYRHSGDVADQVFKVLNLAFQTHPFYVLRLGEIRNWIESGDYDRIVRGDYPRHAEPNPAYDEDLRDAARAYSEEARDFLDVIGDAARRMGSDFMGGFRL
ncbi:MAG: M48 family metallopeptidase [Gemmatimonadota bacterium]|nr:M48 family metallopeptidase [Gemmatimonadota bacterium]